MRVDKTFEAMEEEDVGWIFEETCERQEIWWPQGVREAGADDGARHGGRHDREVAAAGTLGAEG